MRLKQYLTRRRFPELVGHEVVGQAPLYVTELSMRKKTDITYTGTRQSEFKALVTLESGPKFHVDFLRTVVSGDLFGQIKKLTGINPNADSVYVWNLYFEDATGAMSTQEKESGVATDLFAALEIVFKKFYQEKKPELIRFTSAGPSHTKLYKLLSRKIAKAIGGDWREGGGQFIIWK